MATHESEVKSGDMVSGTFSIHNLGIFNGLVSNDCISGVYGIKSAAPIIIPPHACALSLGSIASTVIPHPEPTPEIPYALAPVMTATLSCDHRVVDGAVGAQWLSVFKDMVENPFNMFL